MESVQPQSLRGLWASAESARDSLSSSPDALSQTYADTLSRAVSLYTQSHDLIASSSIFSPNESLDDIATSDIPFLQADLHIAELIQRTPKLQPSERLEILKGARAAYESFLALVDAYGLVRPPYEKMLERYKDDKDGFAAVAGDMASKREGKIANFKAEKQLKEKLAYLRNDTRYVEHGDEEVVREIYLTDILFAIHTALHSLDSLNRELQILAMRPDPTHHSRQGEDFDPTLRLEAAASRPRPGGPLLSKTGKPLQPFTLLPSRGEQSRNVFRPSHNLPTMSIDEYLDEERKRGGIIEGGTQPKTVVDEDDMEQVDRAMYKARDWDEFTDNNPKGAGNTLNKG